MENKTPEKTKEIKLNDNSLIPSIKESERFINFLIKHFNLSIPNNYLITINKANKNVIGFFMPKEHNEHFKNTSQDLHNINLNTIHLKKSCPYECLTHELAHLINHINKIKDNSGWGYHNKHFKIQAEKFYLSVEKTQKGYNITATTEKFNKMLLLFKPQKEVFNICQNTTDKKKKGSRLRLFICGCGVKVRVGNDYFKAVCLECNTKFEKD